MNTNEIFIESQTLPKPLEEQELIKLFQQKEEGNKEVKEKIIKHNIRLVLSRITNKYRTVNYDKKDLVAIGNIGLIKAVETFDFKKNIKFSTYAIKCIDNEIGMFIKKLEKDKYTDSINKIITKDKNCQELILEDIIQDKTDIIEDYIKNETNLLIRELINQLPQNEKQIIIMYFGFFGSKIYTQQEISKKLNISQSYVSRILKKILKKIKTNLISNDIIEKKQTKSNVKSINKFKIH